MAAARSRQATAQRNAPAYGGASGPRAELADALRGYSAGLGHVRTASSASGVLPAARAGAARNRRRYPCPDYAMNHPVPAVRIRQFARALRARQPQRDDNASLPGCRGPHGAERRFRAARAWLRRHRCLEQKRQLWRWSPDGYIRLKTLADIVSRYADQHGPDGSRMVADQWLKAITFDGFGFAACYRLLYLRSEYYGPFLA